MNARAEGKSRRVVRAFKHTRPTRNCPASVRAHEEAEA
jgi:hypothetical protein